MTGGVGAALDEAVAGLPDANQVVEQLLFEPEEIGAMDAPSPLSAAIAPRKRGPGRPPGSRNRRTEAVREYLLSQHRHPVAVMMELYSMTPAQLAERIGLRQVLLNAKDEPEEWGFDPAVLIELLKLQMRMAEAAAPYVAQKMAIAHEVTADGAVQVTLAMGGPDGVSLPARGGLAGRGDLVIEGEVMGVRLPKSDAASRTDD